jgi:hypothetical protein
MAAANGFLATAPLISPLRIRQERGLVPAVDGIYGWFFRNPPPAIPVDDCFSRDGLTLLYVGISPSSPTSKGNIRKRIRNHLGNRAGSSTLRRTLGVLLTERSGFPICLLPSGKQCLTCAGEAWLNRWLDENAMVCWTAHSEPWIEERRILESISPPLNIYGCNHPFAYDLRRNRKLALSQAPRIEGR